MAIIPVQLQRIQPDFFKLKVMLMGPQFSGKTIFSLGSQYLRTLHADVDAYGILSAKCFAGNPLTGTPPIRQDLVFSVPINTVQDMYDFVNYIKKNIKSYDLVVIDTVTDFQRMIINTYIGDDGVASKYDWNPILNIMQQVTQELKRLPIHVIYNAHESETKIPGKVVPAFDGSFLNVYQSHFSEIWRYLLFRNLKKDSNGLSYIEETRYIQCQMDEQFDSKDRTSILEKFEPASLDYIISKIHYQITTNGQNNG